MLHDLYAGALSDAAAREEKLPIKQVELLALNRPSALDVRNFLLSETNMKVIAEIKRASPSRGKIAEISNPAELAQVYESSGAAAVSVLTEGRSFLGSLQDLDQVREAISIPVLRKDFIANEYQVFEARAHGADLVLLIAAGLEKVTLKRLMALVEQLGMHALIETHNEAEVLLACEVGAEIIGINARDLTTFQTDRSLFAELSSLITTDAVKIAESAVRDVSDVEEYSRYGADCVLVGEALVTGDPAKLVSSFSAVKKP